jgi:hypothetical protein
MNNELYTMVASQLSFAICCKPRSSTVTRSSAATLPSAVTLFYSDAVLSILLSPRHLHTPNLITCYVGRERTARNLKLPSRAEKLTNSFYRNANFNLSKE